jgi:branched-chain amino acid aminotransferase
LNTVFLNGRFVPAAEAVVSVFDRSFLYGDGLFETLRVFQGKPFRWEQHYDRMEQGADFLKIRLPFSGEELRSHALRLIELNAASDSFMRISLSRGVGIRGYSPTGAEHPVVVMSLHPAAAHDPLHPPSWRLITSSVRVPKGDLIAQFKTCNKLPNILARAEAESRGADEAILLNTHGEVAEAASSNLFWISEDTVCTPPLETGILPGVTRAVVIELCHATGIRVEERALPAALLARIDAMFVSLSTLGIVEVSCVDERPIHPHPSIALIRQAYHRLLRTETAASGARRG